MFKHLSNNYKGIILAIIGFSVFAVADASTKYLSQYYPIVQIIGVNAAITLPVVLLLSPFMGGLKKTFQTKKRLVHAVRGICNTMVSILIVISFSKLSLATTYTLIFVTPFIITIASIPLYKERVNIHGWISVFAGFAGVMVVLRPGFTDINPWLFVPLATTIFISIMLLLARSLGDEETLISLPMFPSISNFIFLTPIALLIYGLPKMEHLPIFILAATTIIAGLTCTASAFRIAKASIVSPIHYSQMIWAVIFGYFIFGDIPDIWTALGAIIIIASGIYLIETERRAVKYGV